MSFIVRKTRGKDTYEVKNKVTGRVFSYHTTRPKAYAQLRLLEATNPLDYIRRL